MLKIIRDASFYAGLLLMSAVAGCESNGIIVESVDVYGPNDSLKHSVENGEGFMNIMTQPGTGWKFAGHYINPNVFDTDLIDGEILRQGRDNAYFDKPGLAISYFTGHGVTADGCFGGVFPCTKTSACPPLLNKAGAPAGTQLTCRYSPFDKPRCCAMVARFLVTNSPGDKFGGNVNYSDPGGGVRFGESRNSGGWAGAGTNGGTNLVVLDISHGVLPPFWRETLQNASAGVHMIATLMTGGGDTDNVAERGATLAGRWAAADEGSVAQAWLDTMASLPSTLGNACGGLGGGHGFNGCGCHIVVAMGATPDEARSNINETWTDLRNDGRDAKGNGWYSARWLCNYRITSSTQTEWEMPG